MRRTRTILATSAATALLVSAPFAAFADELHEDDGFTAYGSEGQLEEHLESVHGYTDVTCVKETGFGSDVLEYTIDPVKFPNAIALRLQGNKQDHKELWLNPEHGKAYEAPSDVEGDKLNWVIVCTGTAPAGEDPGDDDEQTEEPGTPEQPGEPEQPGKPEEPGKPTDPVNPPIDTDGPAQRPVDGLLLMGGASLLAGVGVVAFGRRLNRQH